jgi:SAM-dependent methyltransferase
MDASEWDERYAAVELIWSAGPNQFVAEETSGLPPGTAVDLGAGEGRNAIHLARLGWQVTAVDFSRVALDKGRQLAGDLPLTWVCADATDWLAPAPVDLVMESYLHVPPRARRQTTANAFASLKVGGTFLLVGHDSTNLTEGTGGPQDPEVLMSAEDVLADLDAVGASYQVIKAGRVARRVDPAHAHHEPGHRPEPGALTAWDCLVRVVRRA